MKQTINKLGFLFLFLENLYLPFDFGFDFRLNYLLFFGFIAYFLLVNRKLRVSGKFLFLYVTVSLVALLIPLLKGNYMFGFVRQFALITYNLLFCYVLINSYKFDFKKIFKDYLSIAYFISIICFIQLIFISIGLYRIIDFSYLGFDMGNYHSIQGRVQAWFEEPSFLVYSIMPAAFFALSRVFNIHKKISYFKVAIILGAIILSKSSIGFLGLIISLIVILFSKYPILKRPIYLSTLIIVVPILAFSVYQVPEVEKRVDDTYELFTNDSITSEEINKTNLSTYALFSNFKVSKKAFSQDFVVGTGFGSYEINYNKYINEVIPESSIRDMYQLNKKDANSLMLRLSVETGIAGLLMFLFFMFKNRIRFSSINFNEEFLWAFNNGIFILIVLRLLRQGHYTSLGFVMFLILFYLSKKENTINERANKVI